MVKFIHAADLHLDSSEPRGLIPYDGAPVDACSQSTRRALENLVELAIRERADVLLIAGDVYDGDWKDARTGLFFVNQLRRLREAGVRCYMIRGNHDAASEISLHLPLPENIDGTPMLLSHTSCQTVDLEDLGLCIHGQSFATRAVKENLAVGYAAARKHAFNIGLLHTCLEGAEGHERYAPCRMEELLARGYDYWALGHIHTRNALPVPGQTPVLFSGNLQGRHIRECGPKGVYVVTVKGQVPQIEFRPIDVYRWQMCVADVTDCVDDDEVFSRFADQVSVLINEHPNHPIAARVELRGRTSLHQRLHDRLQTYIEQFRSTSIIAGNGRFWIEEVRVRTKPTANDSALADGALGELMEYIDQVHGDPERLKQIAQSLVEVQRRLPSGLANDEILRPDDVAWIQELLKDVKPMLASRLSGVSEEER